VQGYLLDTNIVRYWFDSGCPEHDWVLPHIQRLPAGTLLTVSAITLGEIEYGLRVLDEAAGFEAELAGFVQEQFPLILDVTATTQSDYGSIRARLFRKYAPGELRRKARQPEQLVNPVTGLTLGIQENDLWIAAQAVEHNLVVVSNDRLTHIREVASELRVENWASSPGEGG
jgi:tRNA(fMet)-specific endonuclease VapC